MIFQKFKVSIAYILLGVTFLLNVIMPFGYFAIVLYQIALLTMIFMSSYMFVITFAFRRPNVNFRMLELYAVTWIVYLITTLVSIWQFNIILSLILAVYGIFIGIYSLGTLKNEFTIDTNRNRTIPPYICCVAHGTSQVTVTESLVEDKDITKAVAYGSTAHFLLMGIFVLLGASIAMFNTPDWYFVFQFCSIFLWNLMVQSSLRIYELSGKSPRFSFFGFR